MFHRKPSYDIPYFCTIAMKIHVSNSCAQLLLQAGGFDLEKRGTIQVKVTMEKQIP